MDILNIEAVTKQYATHKALDNVSLHIPTGSIFGLLGPNGAGKTSLIRVITQITQPDSGTVYFKGENLAPRHSKLIGYLPEERGLYKKMEVGEQLVYFAKLKGLGSAEAMQKLNAWVERFEIKSWWHKKVEELSKGMQQKIQFIATVIHEPELLILDEPFSGFDPINAALITNEILNLKAKGTTIIFSTHRMETVEQLCDHIALINRSQKILDGSVSDIKNRYRTHEYLLEYEGNWDLTDSGYTVLSNQKTSENRNIAKVQFPQESSTNGFLQQAINKVQIFRFEECLPDMQQIFVKVVEEAKKNPN